MHVSRQNKTRHALMVFTNRLFTCGLPRLAYKVPRTTEDMPSRHQVQRGPEHTVWTPFTVLCRKRQLLSPHYWLSLSVAPKSKSILWARQWCILAQSSRSCFCRIMHPHPLALAIKDWRLWQRVLTNLVGSSAQPRAPQQLCLVWHSAVSTVLMCLTVVVPYSHQSFATPFFIMEQKKLREAPSIPNT